MQLRRHTMHRTLVSLSVLSILVACDTQSAAKDSESCAGAKCDEVDDEDVDEVSEDLCVAIRGNGPLIPAHFGALAAITEQRGRIRGVAGGSSGSISSFLTESVMMNPLLTDCRAHDGDPELPCTAEQTRARTALLYKSILGYGEALRRSDEGMAIESLIALRGQIDAGAPSIAEQLGSQDPAVVAQGVSSLRDLLSSDDFRELADEEALGLMTGPNAAFYARDIVDNMRAGLSFKATDANMFIRPGLLDFRAFARQLGRLGSFYAGPGIDGRGYGPYRTLDRAALLVGSDGGDAGLDGETQVPAAVASFDDAYRWFLDGCAEPGLGKDWPSLQGASVQTDDERVGAVTCGELFIELVGTYRETFARDPSSRSRIDDPIGAPGGQPGPVLALATVSVLEGAEAIEAWDAARSAYVESATLIGEGGSGWDFSFRDNVRFGVWGPSAALETIARTFETWNADGDDRASIKTELFTELGSSTWADILGASPAEPGLAHGVKLADGRVTTGGWSDPDPVEILRASGQCGHVMLLTRRADPDGRGIGDYLREIVRLLGGTADDERDLYELDQRNSAITVPLFEADSVWCTSWNDFSPAQPLDLFLEGYTAQELVPGDGQPAIRGCTPGA